MTTSDVAAKEFRRWWHTAGLTPRQEKIFHWVTLAIVTLLIAGWVFAIVEIRSRPRQTFDAGMQEGDVGAEPEVVRRITTSLTDPSAKTTAYITDAALKFLDPLRGESGKLKAAFRVPGEPVGSQTSHGGVGLEYSAGNEKLASDDYRAPGKPGVYKLAVTLDRATRPVEDLSIITLVPFTQKQKGRIGLYYLGSWPYERGGQPRSPRYANPSGFIEVTHENKDLFVSEHFRLRDFLTKDQRDVWPKYLLLDPKLLDKLELTIAELEASGVKVEHVHVMSGFRTPRYNSGTGNTSGRANLSRHMYGDAADVYVDNDYDGQPDDITGDGRVTIRDAEKFAAMAERVERKHPSLIGGIGIYVACCGHGPFTHLDVRGYRARWRGTGNG